MKLLIGAVVVLLLLAWYFRDDVRGALRRENAKKAPELDPRIPDTTDQRRTIAVANLPYRPVTNHVQRPGPGPDTGTGIRVGPWHSEE